MKVLCSGELYGEIEHEECLACARRNVIPPCGYTFPLLNAIFKHTKTNREGYHVTELLGCLLKAHFDRTDPKSHYVHELLVTFIGTAVHKVVEEALPEDFRSEIEVRTDEIVGSADILGDGILYDLKTVRWLEHRVPYSSHAAQISAYGELLGVEQQVIQYIDVSGPPRCKYCNVVLTLNNGIVSCPTCGYVDKRDHLGAKAVNIPKMEVVRELERRKKILEAGLQMAEPGYLCNYCPHIQCQYNKRKE